jgi:UDP-galactopyranose mutase
VIPAIVAGLHLRWDGVVQRPQHVLSRLARSVPVVVIEEPFPATHDRDEVRTFGGLSVIRPLRARGYGAPFVDERTIATARALAGEESAVWLYTPMMLELADAFAGPLIYDCMDDLAAFDFAPAGMREREHALLDRAAVVFTGGRSLYESRASHGEKVRCLPSGVEYERFSAASGLTPHPVVIELSQPVYGYIGVIDERLDYDILAALASAPEEPNIVLIGPTTKVDPRRFPRRPNVHFTGSVPYASLPFFLAGLNVAIMPFARNASTRSISPTKTLEFFAARIPVATTPIADVLADYGALVEVGDDPAGFLAACARAERPGPGRLDRAQDAARERGWDAIAEKMREDVAAFTGCVLVRQ